MVNLKSGEKIRKIEVVFFMQKMPAPQANLLAYVRNSCGIMALFCLVLLYVFWSSTGDYVRTVSSAVTMNDSTFVCKENFVDARTFNTMRTPSTTANMETDSDIELPTIYFVTPTYPRREQIAEITRLGQTLMHVPNLHWIVADDVDSCNAYLDTLLDRFGIPYTHIASPMPDIYRTYSTIPRGVANRRAALNWIRQNGKKPGVLYFGDDDNTYDLRIFDEIRYTKRVSMFPVGLIGMYAVSTPVVKHGRVIGFFDSWPAKRLWPVDMAGFSISLAYLENSPNATMPYKAGYEEDEFLKNIGLKMSEIEPKAKNCSQILVWHTQTKKEKSPFIHIDNRIVESDETSLGAVLRELELMGVSHADSASGVKAQITKNGQSKQITNTVI